MLSKRSSDAQQEPHSAVRHASVAHAGLAGRLLPGVAVLVLVTLIALSVIELRDPLKLLLERELLAVFVQPGSAGWYRVVLLLVGMSAAIDLFIVIGAGWLVLLACRRSRRFPVHAQVWLTSLVALEWLAYLAGEYMSHAIAVPIALPVGGLLRVALLTAFVVPYFSTSLQVRRTFNQL
ncbi:DUF2569 family protein [Paraburkholderia bonniea]|nr:DUF2569 family protein [Paraburkholderia bonniea]WJF91090.1 DUF2569 family protein [Paraburkholderia bonniea]WJF94405.1 DUF2569 family protein [Paraburkholderia bonniea]